MHRSIDDGRVTIVTTLPGHVISERRPADRSRGAKNKIMELTPPRMPPQLKELMRQKLKEPNEDDDEMEWSSFVTESNRTQGKRNRSLVSIDGDSKLGSYTTSTTDSKRESIRFTWNACREKTCKKKKKMTFD